MALVPVDVQVETWQSLKKRLRPGGRIIANVSDESAVAKAMLEVFAGAVKTAVPQHILCYLPSSYAPDVFSSSTLLHAFGRSNVARIERFQQLPPVYILLTRMMLMLAAMRCIFRHYKQSLQLRPVLAFLLNMGCFCRGPLPPSFESDHTQLHCTDRSSCRPSNLAKPPWPVIPLHFWLDTV